MKKYQQQNNYVTTLAKLQVYYFCDKEIPDTYSSWMNLG